MDLPLQSYLLGNAAVANSLVAMGPFGPAHTVGIVLAPMTSIVADGHVVTYPYGQTTSPVSLAVAAAGASLGIREFAGQAHRYRWTGGGVDSFVCDAGGGKAHRLLHIGAPGADFSTEPPSMHVIRGSSGRVFHAQLAAAYRDGQFRMVFPFTPSRAVDASAMRAAAHAMLGVLHAYWRAHPGQGPSEVVIATEDRDSFIIFCDVLHSAEFSEDAPPFPRGFLRRHETIVLDERWRTQEWRTLRKMFGNEGRRFAALMGKLRAKDPLLHKDGEWLLDLARGDQSLFDEASIEALRHGVLSGDRRARLVLDELFKRKGRFGYLLSVAYANEGIEQTRLASQALAKRVAASAAYRVEFKRRGEILFAHAVPSRFEIQLQTPDADAEIADGYRHLFEPGIVGMIQVGGHPRFVKFLPMKRENGSARNGEGYQISFRAFDGQDGASVLRELVRPLVADEEELERAFRAEEGILGSMSASMDGITMRQRYHIDGDIPDLPPELGEWEFDVVFQEMRPAQTEAAALFRALVKNHGLVLGQFRSPSRP